MNFSTKAKREITKIIVAEMGRLNEMGRRQDLESLEDGLRRLLQEIGQQAYGQVLEQADQANGVRVACACGAEARRVLQRAGQVLTVFGKVSYRRSYYGCGSCGQKFYPLDQTWGIHPGEVSPVLGKLLAIAGVEVAFERARRAVQEFLLLEVSDNTIRKQTQLLGEKQAQCEAGWIRDSQDEVWLQDREREKTTVPERLYGSIDGAQVPVGEHWRELKSLSWYQVQPVYGQAASKAQEISYHCAITPAEEFGPLLWATGIRRQADRAQELIFVCDGARWIWNLIALYFPDAIQIVDWYHACEYLTPIAEAVFSLPEKRKNWLQKVTEWLWQGKIKRVIRACRRYSQHALAAEAAQRAVSYYTNNQQRMDYADYRKHGFWIGSGTVESACKQIATARLKIAGARWTLDGAIATAKARAAWLTGGDYFTSLSRLPLAA